MRAPPVPVSQPRLLALAPRRAVLLAIFVLGWGWNGPVARGAPLGQAPPPPAPVNASLNQGDLDEDPVERSPSPRMVLSSLSAVTLDPRSVTLDLGLGYVYFGDVRVTVGVARSKRLPGMGLDLGAEVRTAYNLTELGLTARAQLLRAGRLALGINLLLGGGVGPRQRDSLIIEAGVPLTLLAGSFVKFTLHPYVQVFSDRLCPSEEALRRLAASDLAAAQALAEPAFDGDRCTGGVDPVTGAPLPNAIAAAVSQDPLRGYDPSAPEYQVEGRPVLGRFVGARLMLRAVIEVALTPRVTVSALLEAPTAGQRDAFSALFNPTIPVNSLARLSGRAGVTVKF